MRADNGGEAPPALDGGRDALVRTGALRGGEQHVAAQNAALLCHTDTDDAGQLVSGNDVRLRRQPRWCSWCRTSSSHDVVQRRAWGRSIHQCTQCAQRTLPCAAKGCKNMARGFLLDGPLGVKVPWHEPYCLVCQDLVVDTEQGELCKLEEGWCSWCFEETTQGLWCVLPAPLRDLYQCTYCSRITAHCQGCGEGFARSHSDWCDLQCAVCAGVLDSWGTTPKIDGKARIRSWCSGCVRHSVHDLEQQRVLQKSVYRCTNCHQRTVPCTSCATGTRLKVVFGGTSEPQRGPDMAPKANDTQCAACASGKEWLDLQRRSVLDASRRQAAPLAQMQQAQAKLLCRLQSFGQIRAFRKDDVLIRQGCSQRRLMVVLDGSIAVETMSEGADGNKVHLHVSTMTSGSIVGELVFLQGGAASASVRCVSESASILVLPRAEVLDGKLLDQDAGCREDVVAFYRFLAMHLCEKIRIANSSSTVYAPPQLADSPSISRSKRREREGERLSHATGGQDVDENVCKLFNIHASEYVTVQRQAAALVHNGKRPLWGHLTATQSYLCFGGDLFGQPTRFAFHFSKIKRLAERDGCESSGHERAYLEVLAYPQEADGDDALFLFLFGSIEERDLFAWDAKAAYKQTHVWRQSRGQVRSRYQVVTHEHSIFTPTAELALPGRGKHPHAARAGGKRSIGLSRKERVDDYFSLGMSRLVEGARAITYDKNDVIIHEGNRDQRLYQIGIGAVRVETGFAPCSTLIARLGVGQVFGEISLIAGGEASASIVADVDNTTVYMFDGSHLRDVIEAEPGVAAGFYRYLANLLADRFRVTNRTAKSKAILQQLAHEEEPGSAEGVWHAEHEGMGKKYRPLGGLVGHHLKHIMGVEHMRGEQEADEIGRSSQDREEGGIEHAKFRPLGGLVGHHLKHVFAHGEAQEYADICTREAGVRGNCADEGDSDSPGALTQGKKVRPLGGLVGPHIKGLTRGLSTKW